MKHEKLQGLNYYIAGLTAVALSYIVALLLIKAPGFAVVRWDNYEIYIPALIRAEEQWLKGFFPLWNGAQSLGEPTLDLSQFGVFYPTHFFCYLFSKILGLGANGFGNIIFFVNIAIGAFGFLRLFAYLNVLPTIAITGTVTLCTLSMVVASSIVWIFTIPLFAIFPWMLQSGMAILDEKPSQRSVVLFAFTIPLTISVGHSQYAAYLLVFCFLFFLVYAWQTKARRKPLLLLALATVCGMLFASPVLLPTIKHLPGTLRNSGISLEEFLNRSMSVSGLQGLLSPFFFDNGFLWGDSSYMLYFGVWTVPALLYFLIANEKQDAKFRAKWIGLALVCVLYLLFALGKQGLIYPLTYYLPVWNSFRYPRKIAFFFGIGTVLMATLMLNQLPGMKGRRKKYALSAITLWSLASIAAMICEADRGGIAYGVAVCVMAAAIAFWKIQHRNFRYVMVGSAIVSGGLLVALVQNDNYNRYPRPLGSIEHSTLQVSPDYRVLPVAVDSRGNRGLLDYLGANYSASVGGFRSATGVYTVLAARQYYSLLPVDYFGILPPESYAKLLNSHLLRSFNVRYLIAPKEDVPASSLVHKVSDRFESRDIASVKIVEVAGALPRAYFASQVFRYSPEALDDGLIKNRADAKAAYIEAEPIAPAKAMVTKINWKSDREGDFYVEVQSTGLLVVSESFHRNWYARLDDGSILKPVRTNGAIMGFQIPAGTREIKLRFSLIDVWQGLGIAFIGGMLLFGIQLKDVGNFRSIAKDTTVRKSRLRAGTRIRA